MNDSAAPNQKFLRVELEYRGLEIGILVGNREGATFLQ
jgi:hypothetical protein